ncbi:MAG: hypothetical protein WDN10_03415 [bacterium]
MRILRLEGDGRILEQIGELKIHDPPPFSVSVHGLHLRGCEVTRTRNFNRRFNAIRRPALGDAAICIWKLSLSGVSDKATAEDIFGPFPVPVEIGHARIVLARHLKKGGLLSEGTEANIFPALASGDEIHTVRLARVARGKWIYGSPIAPRPLQDEYRSGTYVLSYPPGA